MTRNYNPPNYNLWTAEDVRAAYIAGLRNGIYRGRGDPDGLEMPDHIEWETGLTPNSRNAEGT